MRAAVEKFYSCGVLVCSHDTALVAEITNDLLEKGISFHLKHASGTFTIQRTAS